MPRRNTTHLSRLARAVAARTELTYTQALHRARTQAAAGNLPSSLDAAGMSRAVDMLAALATCTPLAPRPLTSTFDFPCVHLSDGTHAALPLDDRTLALHTLVTGATGSGGSLAARALLDHALTRDYDAIYVDLRGDIHDGGLAQWLAAYANHRDLTFAAHELGAASTGVPDLHNHKQVTYVGFTAIRGDLAEALMTSLNDLAQARTETRGQRRMVVVVDDPYYVPGNGLSELVSRARSAGITMLIVDGGLEHLHERHPGVLPNIGSALVLRQGSLQSAELALARLRLPVGTTAEELRQQPIGHGWWKSPGTPTTRVHVALDAAHRHCTP